MNKLLIATFLLGMTAVLSAQTVSSTLSTKAAAGVSSNAGGNTDFASTKANTLLPPIGPFTWRIRASSSKGSGASGVSASLSSYGYANSMGVVVVGLSGLARGAKTDRAYTTPTTSAPGKPGTLSFVMRMSSTPGRKGALAIAWQSLLKNAGSASAAVDVDDNGSSEWKGGDTKGTWTRQLVPVAFDSKGKLVAKLELAGGVQGAGQYLYSSTYGRLDVRFVDQNAGKCTITPYGRGCQGATASGGVVTIGAQHVITAKLSGGYANGFALEAIGNRSLSIPLPGGCTLLSNAISILIHRSDAKGELTVVRKVSTFARLASYHQFLPITLSGKDVVLKAANGLRLVCTGQ